MRLPRVRFTIQRMMVLVAVVALASWGLAWVVRIKRLSNEYERRVERHSLGIMSVFNAALASEHEIWDIKMLDKYQKASRHPWLPVEPDPPEPTKTK